MKTIHISAPYVLVSPLKFGNPAIVQYVRRNSRLVDGETVIGRDVHLVASLASAVINRLSFPRTKRKGKDGKTVKQSGNVRSLSPTDCEEILGIVSSKLAECGAFETGTVPDSFWTGKGNVFSICGSIEGLGIWRREGGREDACDSFDIFPTTTGKGAMGADERRELLITRNRLADCLTRARNRDQSRKAQSRYKGAYRLLSYSYLCAIREDTGWGDLVTDGNPPKWLTDRKARFEAVQSFFEYVSKGSE